jgi:flavorubredoxin
MLDPLSPVEIAPSTFWVGKRDPKSIFHANPYLRIFEGQDPTTSRTVQFNLLIDPGSSADFAVVSTKVGGLIGGLGRLSALFINHQDPDVGSSAQVLSARHAPRASIVCSEDTWRLIVHTGLPRERFLPTERFSRGMRLPTGQLLLPVPSPFCHFKGAVMLYDPETRVLFTGDLFGGLTAEGADGLWADESDWSGIRAFHQMYMPSNQALARAVKVIRALEPKVEILAPQHGRLVRGPLIAEFLRRIEALPVGLDILDESDQDTLQAWSHVLRRVLLIARDLLGPAAEARLAEDQQLADTLRFEPAGVRIESMGRWSVERSLAVLTAHEPPHVANIMKMEALGLADQLGLPAPRIGIEDDVIAESGPFSAVAE